jgi:hypothetical protein
MKMQKWKILAFATAALLILTSAVVLGDGTDNVKDWWTEMTEHHEANHGDDFETHHQTMHGEDWEEHVADCHQESDHDHMDTGDMMGAGRGSMMGTAWI